MSGLIDAVRVHEAPEQTVVSMKRLAVSNAAGGFSEKFPGASMKLSGLDSRSATTRKVSVSPANTGSYRVTTVESDWPDG